MAPRSAARSVGSGSLALEADLAGVGGVGLDDVADHLVAVAAAAARAFAELGRRAGARRGRRWSTAASTSVPAASASALVTGRASASVIAATGRRNRSPRRLPVLDDVDVERLGEGSARELGHGRVSRGA